MKKPTRQWIVHRWTLVFGDVDISEHMFHTRAEARAYKKRSGFTTARIARVRIVEVR